MRVAARREHEERAAECGLQLLVWKGHSIAGDESEHRACLAVAPLAQLGLELFEDPAVGVDVHKGTIEVMRDVLEQLEAWLANGERAALATVVDTRRSAPRPLGSRLAVSESGLLHGSVSGGCVESDVALQAREVIAEGRPRLLPYGIADDDARSVGLPCGGEIDVFVSPAPAPGLVAQLRRAVETGERGLLTTVVLGERAGDMRIELGGGTTAERPALVRENGQSLFVEPR